MKIVSKPKPKIQYYLDDKGCFVIENYNHSKPFSNFFPGVAGEWGTPMWVFYVNRGQGVCSFGIESKDKSILEFQPANKAYRQASLQGFRTFIKVNKPGSPLFWEPFQNNSCFSSYRDRQRLSMTAHDLTLGDENKTLGLKTEVNYFTMPQEDFPALVRVVTFENVTNKKMALEVIDGLPVIVPFGINEWALKNMCRTVEAWVKVKQVVQKTPFFHLNVEIADRPDVKHITEGNFYFSFAQEDPRLLDILVEAETVFGNSADFRSPEKFLETKNFSVPKIQQTSNRMPCAMSFCRFSLPAKAQKSFVTVIGHAHSPAHMERIVTRVRQLGFIKAKAKENQAVISAVKDFAFTKTSSPAFDLYCGQTFLDNVLRGGLPVSLKTGKGIVTFNVYSRKHGDLERDYNYFVLAPTPYSQGNGNYRDVNQNRRNDVWFNPDVGESSIVDFMSLVQADGYNPLVVRGLVFALNDHGQIKTILQKCVKGSTPKLEEKLKGHFQPGELLSFVSRQDVGLKVSPQEFLAEVLAHGHKVNLADHGEGFWADHWIYNLDMIESFLAIYPERLKDLLFGNKAFSFYHNSHYVLPRRERYLLTSDGVRQYHSVKDGSKEIHAEAKGSKLRTRNGEGEVYYTNLLVKLLCLIACKAATLDPSGIGVEMEADKPAWCDSLNGLPGLLGSSFSETLELKRYCVFLLNQLKASGADDSTAVKTFEELADFINTLSEVLQTRNDPLDFWQGANEIKEHYRKRVRMGISGEERVLTIGTIREFLRAIVARVDKAIDSAKDEQGLIPTYLYHEVTEYELLNKQSGEHFFVLPKKFRCHRLPYFLEGFVHLLRAQIDPVQARKLHVRLCKSEIYDRKLKMFKVSADISSQSEGVGRSRVFPRGWLENESIWLHMEYKYILELLRLGLHEEFFKAFREVLIPFQDPERYGRSILENSSFLVSSAHTDKNLHGQGFVARLSGSTAEVIQMWLWMNAGQNPFRWDAKKGLVLGLEPILPGWLFSKKDSTISLPSILELQKPLTLPKNTYAFMFLGKILVVYHNPGRKDTYQGLKVTKTVLTYEGREPVTISGPEIAMPHSENIRQRKVERIDVYLA